MRSFLCECVVDLRFLSRKFLMTTQIFHKLLRPNRLLSRPKSKPRPVFRRIAIIILDHYRYWFATIHAKPNPPPYPSDTGPGTCVEVDDANK